MVRLLIGMALLAASLEAAAYRSLHFGGDGVDLLPTGDFAASTLERVVGYEKPPFYLFWRNPEPIPEDAVPLYTEKLQNYYRSKGYYEAQITSAKKKEELRFTIEKGRPVTVASVAYEGPGYLEPLIGMKEGEHFDTERFKTLKKRLRHELQHRGYARYDLKTKAYVDLEAYSVRLVIAAVPNVRCRFGRIVFERPYDVGEAVLRRLLTFEEGEWFDIEKIEASYLALGLPGFFDTILIEPDLTGEGEQIPILVSLQRGKSRHLKTGIGYDTDEGVRGSISWRDTNVLGDLTAFETGLTASMLEYELFGRYYDPLVVLPWGRRYTLEADVRVGKQEYDEYGQERYAATLSLGCKPFAPGSSAGMMTEYSVVDNATSGLEGDNGFFWTPALFAEYSRDRRDDPLDARQGYLIQVRGEYSHPGFGSDLEFGRLFADLRYIRGFGGVTAAVKLRGAFNSDRLPVFKRFFSGGSMTNRGYPYRRVGAKDPHGYALGGNSLLEGSAELRHAIYGNLGGVLFVDSTLLSLDPFTFDHAPWNSWGTGLRYRTPVGPLRLDVGFPIDDPEQEGYQLHISIGQVF
jgi:outer membrane translocation and assembly module TamA